MSVFCVLSGGDWSGRIPQLNMVRHKLVSFYWCLYLVVFVCRWVFGENNFYDNLSHQFDLDALDNDTMYENVSTFDEITTERQMYKRSTSTIKLEMDTEFTYLNIGVLMASHLGEYLSYLIVDGENRNAE